MDQPSEAGAGIGPGRRAGRPRADLDRGHLHPQVADWAEYLRGRIDGRFGTDAEAAAALGVEGPDLSRFLSGKKLPERSFVKALHGAGTGTGTGGEPGNGREAEFRHADDLYMGALRQLKPTVWKLLSALDERDRAISREEEVQQQLSDQRRWWNRETRRLQRELEAAQRETVHLTRQVNDLTGQVRRLRAEAVVAEAIRVAERGVPELDAPPGWETPAVRFTGVSLVALMLLGSAGVGSLFIGSALAHDATPWRTGGGTIIAAAATVALAAGWLRRTAFVRLAMRSPDGNLMWPAILVAAACVVPMWFTGQGIHSQRDYLEHRSTVQATVSECRQSNNSTSNDSVPTYTCTYTWTIEDTTYQQRDAGMRSEEGQETDILIDPAEPHTMLPASLAFRAYHWLYVLAAFTLALPAWALVLFRDAWKRDQSKLRRAWLRHVPSGPPPAGPAAEHVQLPVRN